MKFSNLTILSHSAFLLTTLSLALCVVNIAGKQEISGSSQRIPFLHKSATVMSTNAQGSVGRELIIEIHGLKDSDLVNLRPSGETMISVKAGIIVRTIGADGFTHLPPVSFNLGVSLPDSSLKVSEKFIVFVRPAQLGEENIVLLDIQIPRNLLAKVLLNNKEILIASIQQPISYRHQQWGLGANNVAGTSALASGLMGDESGDARIPVYDVDRGGYIVPYSNLKTIKPLHIEGNTGMSVILQLQIDESGKVLKATLLAGGSLVSLQSAIKDWQFEPYSVGGQPVPVITVFHLGDK
jgi:hypothetical protein